MLGLDKKLIKQMLPIKVGLTRIPLENKKGIMRDD